MEIGIDGDSDKESQRGKGDMTGAGRVERTLKRNGGTAMIRGGIRQPTICVIVGRSLGCGLNCR